MINKNGKATSKLGICLNVLLHYGKYEKLLGEQVRIIKNDGLDQYNMLIGTTGFVTDFEYRNFSKPIIVTFWENKQQRELCFNAKELETIK